MKVKVIWLEPLNFTEFFKVPTTLARLSAVEKLLYPLGFPKKYF